MKKFKLLSSFLAALMVLSMLAVIPVSAAEIPFEGPYDFEDAPTVEPYKDPYGTKDIENPVANNSYVDNILRSVKSAENDGKLLLDLYTVQPADTNSSYANASGNVLANRSNTDFYLLNNIDTDFGVETYEFDFRWTASSGQISMYLTCQDNGAYLINGNGGPIVSNVDSNKWKHMKIEYDTDADTLSVTVDGELLNTLNGVASFDQPLLMSSVRAEQTTGRGVGSRARVFRMDNYKSYVTYQPNTSLSNLNITMKDESEITLPGDTGAEGLEIKVTANAINTNTEPANVTVIYALYKDDELVDAASQAVTIPKEIFTAQPVSATFTTEANVEFDTVKAFVWDDLGAALSKTVAVSYQAQ